MVPITKMVWGRTSLSTSARSDHLVGGCGFPAAGRAGLSAGRCLPSTGLTVIGGVDAPLPVDGFYPDVIDNPIIHGASRSNGEPWTMPTVSVVMLSYNRKAELRLGLERYPGRTPALRLRGHRRG